MMHPHIKIAQRFHIFYAREGIGLIFSDSTLVMLKKSIFSKNIKTIERKILEGHVIFARVIQ